MKFFRIITAILSITTMIFFFCACNNPPVTNETSQGTVSHRDEATGTTSNENLLIKQKGEESAVMQLDAECQEKLSESSSNADITETYELYSNKMKNRIDEYNTRIGQFAERRKELFSEQEQQENFYAQTIIGNAESVVSTFEDNCARWQEWSKKAISDNRLYLEGIYSGGSIVPVLQAKYEYQVFYQRAVELANLCDCMY